jgi:predicted RNase H-like HicB family nuclease
MPSQAAGYILLTFKVHEEGEQYVSECIELGVASCGATIDEAFEAIRDATTVYLQTLEDEGELEQVFAERAITILAGEPPEDGRAVFIAVRPGECGSPETLRIPVPA